MLLMFGGGAGLRVERGKWSVYVIYSVINDYLGKNIH